MTRWIPYLGGVLLLLLLLALAGMYLVPPYVFVSYRVSVPGNTPEDYLLQSTAKTPATCKERFTGKEWADVRHDHDGDGDEELLATENGKRTPVQLVLRQRRIGHHLLVQAVIPPPPWQRLRVRGPDGEPVRNTRVTVSHGDMGFFRGSSRVPTDTDAEGCVTLHQPPGMTELQVQVPGIGLVSVPDLDIPTGENTEMDLPRLAPVRPRQAKLPESWSGNQYGIQLVVHDPSAPTQTIDVLPGTISTYRHNLVDRGLVRSWESPPPLDFVTEDVQVSTNRLAILGTVYRGDGRPLPHADVVVNSGPLYDKTLIGKSDGQGRFRFDVPPRLLLWGQSPILMAFAWSEDGETGSASMPLLEPVAAARLPPLIALPGTGVVELRSSDTNTVLRISQGWAVSLSDPPPEPSPWVKDGQEWVCRYENLPRGTLQLQFPNGGAGIDPFGGGVFFSYQDPFAQGETIVLAQGERRVIRRPQAEPTRRFRPEEPEAIARTLRGRVELPSGPASIPVIVESNGEIFSTEDDGRFEIDFDESAYGRSGKVMAWHDPVSFGLDQSDAVLTNLVWFPIETFDFSNKVHEIRMVGRRAGWVRGTVRTQSPDAELRLDTQRSTDQALAQERTGDGIRFPRRALRGGDEPADHRRRGRVQRGRVQGRADLGFRHLRRRHHAVRRGVSRRGSQAHASTRSSVGAGRGQRRRARVRRGFEVRL